MSQEKSFKDFDHSLKKRLMEEYQGETDILRLLDNSHLTEDLDGLMKEIARHPSVYAYWANLKRLAEETYDRAEKRFELAKAKRVKIIVEMLKGMGVKMPTSKMVDSKFHETYRNEEWYQKLFKSRQLWKKRRDELVILDKALIARENSFKSLSYLVTAMMNKGIIHYEPKRS